MILAHGFSCTLNLQSLLWVFVTIIIKGLSLPDRRKTGAWECLKLKPPSPTPTHSKNHNVGGGGGGREKKKRQGN